MTERLELESAPANYPRELLDKELDVWNMSEVLRSMINRQHRICKLLNEMPPDRAGIDAELKWMPMDQYWCIVEIYSVLKSLFGELMQDRAEVDVP